MKLLFTALFCFVSVFLAASDAQKLPEIKDPLLKENLNIIDGVFAFRIIETKTQKGVVARYRTFYKEIDLKKRPGDYGFVTMLERNKSREKVYITGLDHNLVTSDGAIFHKIIGVGQKGLWIWRIGTETVKVKYERRTRTLRLKKYTVDPKEALEYYKKNPPEKQNKLKK